MADLIPYGIALLFGITIGFLTGACWAAGVWHHNDPAEDYSDEFQA